MCFCVRTKLLPQNMFKCLRSVFRTIVQFSSTIGSKKKKFSMHHISPSCCMRRNPTVSSRDWLWSESQKLISLPPTSSHGFQGSKQAIKAKTQDWLLSFWDFSFLVGFFFQLFYKIIAISYRILIKIFSVMILTYGECLCWICFWHSSFICLRNFKKLKHFLAFNA